MPKELIHTRDTFAVSVGWSGTDGGSTVQIGVGVTNGRSLFWQLAGIHDDAASQDPIADDDLERLGAAITDRFPGLDNSAGVDDASKRHMLIERARSILNLLDCTGSPEERPASSYSGVWACLDRHQINQTIKVLRRARDQAYGRDE